MILCLGASLRPGLPVMGFVLLVSVKGYRLMREWVWRRTETWARVQGERKEAGASPAHPSL